MSKQTKTIKVKGVEIDTVKKNKKDFISITDIAKYKTNETGLLISHWLRRKFSIEFLGVWEQIHNKNFNITEFGNIKNQSGSNSFVLTVKQWTQKTHAIGIFSKAGRYGGTYAHKDIAFEFASWISAEFKLYLIKEFQRLKEVEISQNKLDWDLKRNLAKINYRIHIDAVKQHLVPRKLTAKQTQIIYASEADVLNKALFGQTAKEWRQANTNKKGNLRDYATVQQLVCLSNLESLNAEFIRQKLPQSKRLQVLNQIAINQIKSLLSIAKLSKLTT